MIQVQKKMMMMTTMMMTKKMMKIEMKMKKLRERKRFVMVILIKEDISTLLKDIYLLQRSADLVTNQCAFHICEKVKISCIVIFS